MTGAAADRKGRGSRRRLDLRTRTEVLRLARRGQGNPQPEVSLRAYQWASDRPRVTPLERELFFVFAGAVVGAAILMAVLLLLHQSAAVPVAILVLLLPGMCGWTVYLHRRVKDVARLNRPHAAEDA
jgi:hypothetical protein